MIENIKNLDKNKKEKISNSLSSDLKILEND